MFDNVSEKRDLLLVNQRRNCISLLVAQTSTTCFTIVSFLRYLRQSLFRTSDWFVALTACYRILRNTLIIAHENLKEITV